MELRIAIAMPTLDEHARTRAADQDWELSLLGPLDPDARAIDGDPPEAIETAGRLLALGRNAHEVLHMLGSTVSAQVWKVLHDQRPYSRAEHVAALAALPASCDRQAARARSRPQRRVRSSRRRRRD